MGLLVSPLFAQPMSLAATLVGIPSYLSAIQRLQEVTAGQALITAERLYPIAVELQAALRALDLPASKQAAIDAGVSWLAQFISEEPRREIAVEAFLLNLEQEGLLPRPHESPEDAMKRLRRRALREPIPPARGPKVPSPYSPALLLRGLGERFGALLLRMGARLHRPPKTTVIQAPVVGEPPRRGIGAKDRPTIEELRRPPTVVEGEVAPLPLPERWRVDPETGCLLIRRSFKAGADSFDGIAVSDYRLQSMVGRGGMARVYLGYEIDPESEERELIRKVAVKIASLPLHEEEKRQLLVKKFNNERRLQTAATSDRVVRVFTTGVTATDEPYIVMEFLTGGGLEDAAYDAERPFDLAERIDWIEQAVAAVAEGAHAGGIVHRDIKPGNFFRTDRGRLKLGDFGIAEYAEVLQQEGGNGEGVVGTPGYLPPESWRGEPATYSRDVFALGAMAYELLTGELPYEPSANYLAHYMAMTHGNPPLPPSEKAPDRNIPPELDRIVMKALAIDPSQRYPNAAAMLQDLLTYRARSLEEQAESFRQPSWPSRRVRLAEMAHWKNNMLAALQEYRSAYDRYPLPELRQRIIAIDRQLYPWADERGDIELMQAVTSELGRLDPEGDIVASLHRPVEYQFSFSPPPRPGSDLPEVTVHRFTDRDGFLEPDGLMTLDPTSLPFHIALSRGPAYAIRVIAKGMHPLFVPLPVRPAGEPHEIRLPLYPTDEISEGFLVVPAGPVAVRTLPGRYGEKMELCREIAHDYAIGPKVTVAQYLQFLKAIRGPTERPEEELNRFYYRYIPRNWAPEIRRALLRQERVDPVNLPDVTGQLLHPDAPVTHIPYEAGLAYFEWAYPGWGARYPTPDEWKRAFRGNDFRQFPWGDAIPIPGTGDWRYPGHEVASQPLPVIGVESRDRSPFSLYGDDGLVYGIQFLVSGTPIYLTNDDPARFLPAVGLAGVNPSDSAAVAAYALLAGHPYYAPAPTNAEILTYVRIDDAKRRAPGVMKGWEPDYVGPFGIMPVIPLRQAGPTPTRRTIAA